jgi:hypothetical protein
MPNGRRHAWFAALRRLRARTLGLLIGYLSLAAAAWHIGDALAAGRLW